MALLEVIELTKHYPIRSQSLLGRLGFGKQSTIKAVERLNFSVGEGEILGIVGESGSGKSTTCGMLAKLIEPTSGMIQFGGKEVSALDRADLRQFRRQVQMIFQDPFDSLNPRFRVRDLIAEAPRALGLWNELEIRQRTEGMLETVGLRPDEYLDRYPHQMSGGERQRVGIASALIVEPKLVIADEPVSMLDVSIRAGVLDLLRKLSRTMNFTCIYVSHDLSILTSICDRVVVMYLGQMVEIGSAAEIVNSPQHPYTQALVAAVPIPDPHYRRPRIYIKGEPALPIDPPIGCRFVSRCHYAREVCGQEVPPPRSFSSSHFASCYAVPLSRLDAADE